jgi:hypothetical protein
MDNYYMDPSKDYDNSGEVDKMNLNDSFEEAAAAFYKATGYLMPGKDGCLRDEDGDLIREVELAFKAWCAAIEYMKRSLSDEANTREHSFTLPFGPGSRCNNCGWNGCGPIPECVNVCGECFKPEREHPQYGYPCRHKPKGE